MSSKFAANTLLTWLPVPIAHVKMDFPCGISNSNLVWLAVSFILLSLAAFFILNYCSAITAVALNAWWVYRRGTLNKGCQQVLTFTEPISQWEEISSLRTAKLWYTASYGCDSPEIYLHSMLYWQAQLLLSPVSCRIYHCDF